MGEMSMSIFELEEITARSLFNKIYGFRRYQREGWEQTRLQCFYTISPHLPEQYKSLTITEFMPFHWDDEQLETSFERIKKDAAEARKKSQAVWAKIDGEK